MGSVDVEGIASVDPEVKKSFEKFASQLKALHHAAVLSESTSSLVALCFPYP